MHLIRKKAHVNIFIIGKNKKKTQKVNEIRVSRDNLFVATGSSDSTVRIWSCSQIQSMANIKAAQVYNGQKGAILSLCLLDSSHSVASGSSEGSVHVNKVEYMSGQFHAIQNKLKIDPKEGGILCLEHFNTLTESMLAFGTHSGCFFLSFFAFFFAFFFCKVNVFDMLTWFAQIKKKRICET